MEKNVVLVQIGYHFTQEGLVREPLLEKTKVLEETMAELGCQVKWQVEPIGGDINTGGGLTVGILGPPPRGFLAYDLHPAEEAVEAANLDREDSPTGRRIRALLKCNNEELAMRRVAEQQTGRREIIIEALLDTIQMGAE